MRPAPSRSTSWRSHAAIVFGLLMASLWLEAVRVDHAITYPSALDYWAMKGDESLRLVVATLVFVGALQFIDRLPRRRRWRNVVAVAVTFAASLLGTLLIALAWPNEPTVVRLGGSASVAVWFWYRLWVNTLVGLLALVIAERLRARREAIERLAERQERGRVVRQQLAYAQLQAIQARVDPQLLFDMLAAVKRYYEHDADRAERLLDELTAFLRAALPRLRSARSSLEVEFGLVGCYVRMLRAAGDVAIELKASLPAALASAAFPAGLLLPLLPRAAGAERCIALDAQADADGPLRVRVTESEAPEGVAVDRLRVSLSDLYGERGRLCVRMLGEAGAEIELEVPREHE